MSLFTDCVCGAFCGNETEPEMLAEIAGLLGIAQA